jgi:hypothetical protein
MKGEVIYLYAYDIAYEADLGGIEAMMRGTAERFTLGRLKDAPRDFPVYRALSVQMEPMQVECAAGPLTLSVSVKVFAVGAISLKVRTPVFCERLADLTAFRDLRLKEGDTLDERVHRIAQQIFENVKPKLDTPVGALEPPEVYTIFCLNTPLAEGASGEEHVEEWLRRNERGAAALLTGEPDPARLSDQEVQETLKYKYSYYHRDLVIVDWDAAFIVDTPEGYHDTLYVLEAANLQLEELQVYDGKLDAVLDKAYDDVEKAARPRLSWGRQRVIGELREIKMDLTKVSDELSNITKFIGDWHLARIYMGCSARFHLAEWQNNVDQKLGALDGLYTMLQHDSFNRMMLVLEVAIVALFVVDLIIIIALGLE